MAPSVLLDSSPSLAPVSSPLLKHQTPNVRGLQTGEPALLYRSLLETPHNVVNASGSFLHLDDERKILDGCGGAAVAIIGHANQEVIELGEQGLTPASNQVTYLLLLTSFLLVSLSYY